jgi:hypothetical protein
MYTQIQQTQTYLSACACWTDSLRAADNFAPFRPLFETLDHSALVVLPWELV